MYLAGVIPLEVFSGLTALSLPLLKRGLHKLLTAEVSFDVLHTASSCTRSNAVLVTAYKCMQWCCFGMQYVSSMQTST
jgi:hypothetical protein